jgi:hypothetical protein
MGRKPKGDEVLLSFEWVFLSDGKRNWVPWVLTPEGRKMT